MITLAIRSLRNCNRSSERSTCDPSIICRSSGSNSTKLNTRQKWANWRAVNLVIKAYKSGTKARLKVSIRTARISSNKLTYEVRGDVREGVGISRIR